MIPRKLRISGFLSYKNPVEIDFSGIHVACISGSNGAGKSAMLDAITWALFGEARQTDESIINNTMEAPRAEVAFEFEYESNRYQIVRTREKGKSSTVDVLIWNDAEAESEQKWRPLSEKSVRETNKLISSLLHLDYATFINASFFLQGKADQFTNQNATERKKILSNILNLDIWEKYQTIASEKRKARSDELALTNSRLEDIERELAEEDVQRQRLAELETQLNLAENNLAEKQRILQSARTAAALIESQKTALKTQTQMVENLANQLTENEERLKKRKQEQTELQKLLAKETAIHTAYDQFLSVRSAAADWAEKAKRFNQISLKKKELEHEIEMERVRLTNEQSGLKREQDQFRLTAENIPEMRTQLESLLQHRAQLQLSITEKEQNRTAIDEINAAEKQQIAEQARLRSQMDTIKSRMDQLKEAASGSPCPFCGRELDTAHSEAYLESLQNEGEGLGDSYRSISAGLKMLHAQKDALEQRMKELDAAEKRLHELALKINPLEITLQSFAATEPRRQEISQRLNEIETLYQSNTFCAHQLEQLDQIRIQLDTLQYDAQQHQQCLDQEKTLAPVEQEWQEVQKAKSISGQLQREIQELENQIASSAKHVDLLQTQLEQQRAEFAALNAGQPDLDSAERAHQEAQNEANEIRSETAKAKQRVEGLTSLKQQKKALLSERNIIMQQVTNYRTLEKAFSKNGIPAILIDEALPEITETANAILGRLTDERMSVQFTTQREYKDKSKAEKRETLDINISDENGTRPYELFSGGEAFRVNFAIRLALSSLLTKRAGARLQMLVVDEGFGSQDADGRQRLIEAITAIQQDFEKILVITHLEELKDVFPSRIEVEKTENGSKVMVIV